ncbi:MAG: tetratricopeptide repeat protein [Candidatus Cloacimonadales bacterium]|nr:tetratricopeptide repeat protein [Candidatus Cloacimonadales bacterium]
MKKSVLIALIVLYFGLCFSATTHIDSLESAVKKVRGLDKVHILNQLSDIYQATSPRKSIELSTEAYEIASNLKDNKAMAVSLNNIGESNYRLGNYQQALSYHLNALNIFMEMNDKAGLAKSHQYTGMTQLRLCNYDRALYYFLNSLQIDRELDNQPGVLKALNSIGELYYNLNNYDKALEYYQEALALEDRIGSLETISITLNNIGLVHLKKGDFNNALQYYMRSLQVERETNNTSGIATAFFNLGLVYKNLQDYDKALDYFGQSLDLTLESGSKYEIADTFINIGNIYVQLNQLDLAFANLTQGLQIATDINARSLLQDGYYSFYEYFSKKGVSQRAFEYYKLYAIEKERILTNETSRQLSELQTGFTQLDNEKQIALQEKDQEIGKLVSDKKRLFNLLLICGGIAVLSATGILYYRNRQAAVLNRKLQQEVLEKEDVEKQLNKRLVIEKIISSISSRFIKIDDFNNVIKISLEEIGKICNASKASLFLISEDNSQMDRTHEWIDSGLGMLPPSVKSISIDRNNWWMEQLKHGAIIHVDDVSMMPVDASVTKVILDKQGVKAALAFPIKFKNKLIGFVSFENVEKTDKWPTEDFALLGLFSETIGLYFERKELEDRLRNSNNILETRVQERTKELAEANQELQIEIAERRRAQQELNESFLRLKKAMEETVNALISAVEIRDPYTAGHQLRVATLSREIGLAMGLSKEELDGIRIAAILHDIGKIYVPAEILTKPSSLTETEFSMIKNHPLAGYDILKTIDFDLPVAMIVYQHHERMDGSGYPQGLAGNEIMLESRIVHVADVVDAMISQRPYRSSQGIDEALHELQRYAGIRYDEEVVRVCLELFTTHGFQFEEIKVRTSQRK